MIPTVAQLEVKELSPMLRDANRTLMVAWINADLLNRAQHDVRKSVVLYDEDRMFVHAMDEVPDPELLQRLYDKTTVRYWSVGA